MEDDFDLDSFKNEIDRYETKQALLNSQIIDYKDLEGAEFYITDDKEVMLKAVYNVGSNFQYASERLKDDEDVAYTAVYKSAYALAYASERLQDDPNLCLIGLKRSSNAIYYMSDRLSNLFNSKNQKRNIEILENFIKIEDEKNEDNKEVNKSRIMHFNK